jgi:hypothetical protein
MIDRQELRCGFPWVRNGFAMDISKQEYCLLTGLSDGEEVSWSFCITKGDWANNWVPDFDSLWDVTVEEKSSLFR